MIHSQMSLEMEANQISPLDHAIEKGAGYVREDAYDARQNARCAK